MHTWTYHDKIIVDIDIKKLYMIPAVQVNCCFYSSWLLT